MTARNADGRASSSPLVILSGATATGKTDLVLEIARRLPVDIISADAAQVYRRMDIGTAKPDPETLHRFPHRLIDIRDPHESYSAAEFRRDAIAEIEASLERGRIPLVTGGTMFYLSALVNGLSELPSADEKTRSEILDWAGREGWDALHAALTRIDPPLAKRIDRADRQRLQRAHEIHRVTGRPPSEAMRQSGREGLPHRPIGIAVFRPSRASLHLRIARRAGIHRRGVRAQEGRETSR